MLFPGKELGRDTLAAGSAHCLRTGPLGRKENADLALPTPISPFSFGFLLVIKNRH